MRIRIGQAHGTTYRKAKLFERGLHKLGVLGEDNVQVTVAFLDVAHHCTATVLEWATAVRWTQTSPRESGVRIGVHKNLHVKHVANLGKVKKQQSLDEDDIGRIDDLFGVATISHSERG